MGWVCCVLNNAFDFAQTVGGVDVRDRRKRGPSDLFSYLYDPLQCLSIDSS